jgi:WD40 repeat protein
MEPEVLVAAQPSQIHTNSVSYVTGSIHVEQGDFIGRDKIVHTTQYFIQQARSAIEDAEKAHQFARQRLAEGVRGYAYRLAELANGDTAGNGTVYKGLSAYRLGDAEIFFGRNQAIEELARKLQNGALTLLHAQSGAGKTSLLQAGIAPRLLAAGALPLYVRPYDVPPGLAVKRIFLPNLSATRELEQASLQSFLRQVTEVLGVKATLYILLDQFEEVFTLVNAAERQVFIKELAACLADETLPVRWLLALRSDFFSNLATFGPAIENPFANQYRLGRLTPEEARHVMLGPAERQGFRFEPELVDALLAELPADKGKIEPPQLQLVCLALYENLLKQWNQTSAFPPLITEAIYIEQGRASGILGGYLNQVLVRELPGHQERELARRLLVALVSSEKRRIRCSRCNLAGALAASIPGQPDLDALLERLVHSRLLNVEKDVESDEPTYELVHDYLLAEIEIDPEVQAQKAAQELLTQAVKTYRRFHTLLSQEQFNIIKRQQKYLLLDDEARQLLRSSEERHRFERRQVVMAWAAIVTLFVVVLSIGWLYNVARLARNQAVQARNATQALRLAAESLVERTASPQRGLLLALEAANFLNPDTRQPIPQTITTLRDQFDQWDYWQTTLLAHTKSVRAVRFARTDDQLFSAALDGRVLAWQIDKQGGAQVQELFPMGDAIDAVALHPTQEWIAVGTQRGEIKTARLHHALPASVVWQAHADNARVLALAFTADGKLLISGGADGAIKFWDAEPATPVLHEVLNLPNQDECLPECWVRTLAVSPDGQWLAAGAQNHRLYLWRLAAGQPPALIWNIKLPANIWAVAINRDNRWLAAGDDDGSLYIYRLDDMQRSAGPTPEPAYYWRDAQIAGIYALTFSPLDNRLAIGDRVGVVGLASIGESGGLRILGRLDAAIESIAFSPSGHLIATGGEDRSVRIWQTEPANREPQVLQGHTGRVRVLVFHPQSLTRNQPPGSATLVSASEDQTIRFWAPDVAVEPLHVITETGNPILAAAVSPDGRWLSTGGRDGHLRLYPLPLAVATPSMTAGSPGAEIVAIVFSPDGRLLAAGAADQRIYLWRVDDLAQPPQVLENGQGGILALAFSANGQWLAAGDEARRVKLWDLRQSPPVVRSLYTHNDAVWAVAFSPDGRYLASASADSMIRLTPLQQGAAQGPVFAHERRVRTLLFDRAGDLLVTAGDDFTVKLWNPNDLAQQPAVLRQHHGIVRALAFHPAGDRLASGGDDHAILVWTVHLPDLREMACARTARNLTEEEWRRFFPGQGYHVSCPEFSE